MTVQKFNTEITDMIQNMITEEIFVSNLSEFADEAKQLIAYADKNDLDADEVLEELFDSFESQYLLDLEDMQYQCLRDVYAFRMFLYTDWTFYRKQSSCAGNTSYNEKLLTEISHNEGRQIDNEKTGCAVNELLELIGTDIDLFAIMPDSYSLNIALVDIPETRYEGYEIGHMPTSPNRLYHQVIVSNLVDNPTKGNRMYTLLKALGSVYLFSLTSSFEKMSKSFSAVKKAFTIEAVEPAFDVQLFAELFAMALCTKPELKQSRLRRCFAYI